MTFDQFQAGSKVENPNTPDDKLRKTFISMDVDGNGTISKQEFMALATDDKTK